MNDELVKNIDRRKLDFMGELFADSQGKSQKEMMGYMMTAMKRAKKENLTFTPAEMTAAVNAIKKHSSEDERKKIEQILDKTKANKTTQ